MRPRLTSTVRLLNSIYPATQHDVPFDIFLNQPRIPVAATKAQLQARQSTKEQEKVTFKPLHVAYRAGPRIISVPQAPDSACSGDPP